MATKKQCTTCPMCGSKVEVKAEAPLLKSKDLIVDRGGDARIYWRIEEDMTDMGAAVGEGLSLALSKKQGTSSSKDQYMAVELIAASLAPKFNGYFHRGSLVYPSESAAAKAKSAIIAGANILLSGGNWDEARKAAREAKKKIGA